MARILAISSQVVYGAVGNSAGVFALQRLGHEVWPVPTTLLSHHPGYGRPAGGALPAAELLALIRSLDDKGWLSRCGALISGYLAAPEQAGVVLEAQDRLMKANPHALYLCDPVLGDEESGVYAAPGVAEAMRDMIARADIATPNLFELSALAGQMPSGPSPQDLFRLSGTLRPARVCLTSAPAETGRIGVFVRDGDDCTPWRHNASSPRPRAQAIFLVRCCWDGSFGPERSRRQRRTRLPRQPPWCGKA